MLLAEGEVEFRAYVTGAAEGAVTYHWAFEDGVEYDMSGSDKAVVTNLYTEAGLYTVRLTVVDSNESEVTVVREACVRIAPETLYVSEESTSVPPYASWKTAANLPLDAVAMATAGSWVVLSKGI